VSGSHGGGDCLSENEALGFAHGFLDAEARLRVESHIDVCDGCRRLVSELARDKRSDPGIPDLDRGLFSGQRVGRFVVGEHVGSGAMGAVYAAYDPELDRKVALKVLRSDGNDEAARARWLTEARAMARLSHPGVVPIHDVETIGGAIVLAMELVDGQNARHWLDECRPTWRQAVEILAQAGRGLAAAHRAGIVHRDVKPANILIGRDGRARISDFGLAHAGARDAEPAGSSPALPGVTRTGEVLGTPAYMSPEQHRGERADARSDQFSFCVVLYEAVYGERPFAPVDQVPGFRLEDLAAAVTAGNVRPPPRGSRVPGWLRGILLRGLAADVAARWTSMDTMLDALAEAPRRGRRRWALAAGTVAAAAMVVAWRVAQPPACGDGPDLLDRTWSPAARAAAIARIAEVGAYGRSLAPRLSSALEEHRARWLSGYRDACVAHRSGAQSSALLDRRMACLERGRAALAATAELIGAAEAGTLSNTIVAVRALPDPASCGDIAALLASVPPPAPELAPRVAAVTALLERGGVLLRAGRSADAWLVAVGAVASARALGYRPLLARALLLEGRAAMELDERGRAGPSLAEASALAIEVGDDALAVEAWARRAWAEGTGGKPPDEALAGRELIEALAKRSPGAAFSRALLYNNLGAIAFSRGRRDEARAWHERAAAESVDVNGPDAIEVINFRGNAASAEDDPARRDALLAEAESALAKLLGPDHPQTLSIRVRRANWIPGLAAARDLLGPACDSYESFHQALLTAPALECWTELGFVADELGDRDAALAWVERAAAVPRSSNSVEALGYLELWRGDAPAARERFRAALGPVAPRSGEALWTTFVRGRFSLGLGRALRQTGDSEAARQALETAVADLEQVMRAQPASVVRRRLARARAALALVLVAAGDAGAAATARAAAEELRAEGGRSVEIVELERAASGH
jgi:tetratricopeptide (TPR) repeat protein